jgi:hypothetical protein
MKDRRWQDVAMLVLGFWLIVSPFVLLYSETMGIASLNSYLLGVAVMVFAAIALYQPHMWEEWVNLVLGIWLIVAPIVLGFRTEMAPTVNHFIVGVLIVIDALWAMYPRITHRAT